MNDQTQVREMGMFKKFLLWPSGAIPGVLARCPSELGFYVTLGILIFFNSALAGCGMALMLGQSGASSWAAAAGGLFWFLCVLNLDRFLQMTGNDSKGIKKLMPVVRVLLSLCLAVIVGEHVVQFLFRSEINDQLAQEGLEAQRANYNKALEGYPEIAALMEEKTMKQGAAERKEEEVGRLRDDYIKEAEGTAGSRIKGKGPLFEQKQRDYQTALAERRQLEDELKVINDRLEEKSAQLRRVVNSANEAKAGSKGFLAFHHALFEIIKRDFTLLTLYLVIITAMTLFEALPQISKFAGKGRLHDHLAEKQLEFRKREEEERHETGLLSLNRESQSKADFAVRVARLQADTLNEVTSSIQNDTDAQLSGDKAALAKAMKDYVYGNILAQMRRDRPCAEAIEVETSKTDLEPSDSSAVSVVLGEEGGEEPFTIIFNQPQEEVRGSDLIYALAGLERLRPAGAKPRVPLHECTVTNADGEKIELNTMLFTQIGPSNAVYLSPFEPTVSNAEN